MQHSPRFLQLVETVKAYVKEISWQEFFSKQQHDPKWILVDVREDNEWIQGHVPAALHLARGVIERDIETKIPSMDTSIALYCGGGFRSALAAHSLQQMGYQHVYSILGGFKGFVQLKTEGKI